MRQQQELAERAKGLATKTAAKRPSKFKKELESHMWVLSKDSSGAFLVTIGDPRKGSSKIKQRFSGPGAKQDLEGWIKYDMRRVVSEDHVYDMTGLKLVPENYSQFYIDMLQGSLERGQTRGIPKGLLSKLATTPEQWELAGEILDKGMQHDAFKALSTGWDKIVKEMGDAQKRSKRMRQIGVGRTEDPTFLLTIVVPAMEDYHKTMGKVIDQLKRRVGGR